MGRYSELITQARIKKFKSSKAFWREKKPSCSYAQYVLIEKGTDLPLPVLAAEIATLIEVPLKRALYGWAYDSMPRDDLKELFSKLEDDISLPDPSEIKALTPMSPPLVINRMQAQMLTREPLLYEILSYMATFTDDDNTFEIDSLAQVFEQKNLTMKNLIEKLYQYGLVDKNLNGEFKSKPFITIPNERDLDALQQMVFHRSLNSFEAAVKSNQPTLRATLTRLLSQEQLAIVEHRFRALRNWVWSLPTIKNDSTPYTIGIFGSAKRFP